ATCNTYTHPQHTLRDPVIRNHRHRCIKEQRAVYIAKYTEYRTIYLLPEQKGKKNIYTYIYMSYLCTASTSLWLDYNWVRATAANLRVGREWRKFFFYIYKACVDADTS